MLFRSERAKENIDRQHPGDFNQAIMEFGALQCKPVPDCTVCPLKSGCVAFRENSVSEYPVKSKKQDQRKRYFNYLFITSPKGKTTSVFLNKRTEKDIWKNLYDFPSIETEKVISLKKLMLSKEWKELFGEIKVKLIKESKTYRHILSHQVIMAKFYHLEVSDKEILPFLKMKIIDIETYPVPRLIEMFLEELAKW